MVEVLCFLQELLEKGNTFSIIKVYLAAILACRVGFGDNSPGKRSLVCRVGQLCDCGIWYWMPF